MNAGNDRTAAIRVTVNGESREVPEGQTVAGLLELLSLPGPRVAVERNREILRRDRFPEVVLEDGDRLEIVHFIGGG